MKKRMKVPKTKSLHWSDVPKELHRKFETGRVLFMLHPVLEWDLEYDWQIKIVNGRTGKLGFVYLDTTLPWVLNHPSPDPMIMWKLLRYLMGDVNVEIVSIEVGVYDALMHFIETALPDTEWPQDGIKFDKFKALSKF